MHAERNAGDPAYQGQAVYTPRALAVYDMWVLGVSNRLIWRCPTPRLLDFYNANVSADHLDVGVGTGYFLDRCRFPVARPAVTLMDMNANSLAAAAGRIRRYEPRTHRANVLEPIDVDALGRASTGFGSIGVNYLLHCLPGTIAEKAVALANLKPLLRDGAPLFGSTILNDGVRHTAAARRLMAAYNAKGIFSNLADDLPGLRGALADNFARHRVEVRGSVALFVAWSE